MKRSVKAIGIAALALLLAAVLFFTLRRKEEPIETPPSSAPTETSEPGHGKDTSSTAIPDMKAGEAGETPYETVDPDALSDTTLTETEIVAQVRETLDGLMKLDPKAVEHISIRSTGGDRNPFYYMFASALENKAIGNAFKKLGGAASYEVIRYEISDRSPNIYTVYLNCKVPYAADIVAPLASSESPSYMQEFSGFAESRAAEKLAETDLSKLPVSSDIVALTVIVEDDVPLLYHPVSLNYGNRNPQYAFLWGGICFQGISGGDLLIENTLGDTSEVDQKEFLTLDKNTNVLSFVESGLKALQKGNLDAIQALSLVENDMSDTSFFTSDLPKYRRIDENVPGTLAQQMKRLASLEYSLRFFEGIMHDMESTPRTFIELTYSVSNPDSGGRAYYHTFFDWDKEINQRMTSEDGATFKFHIQTEISTWDGRTITDALSQVMTDALGGDQNRLSYRLLLRDAKY